MNRVHIVLVPGFAGFDALGQLEYYAGVTEEFLAWQQARAAGPWAALHYFDNLPTAAVATRAARLGRYLAQRFARGDFAPGDTVALVGHSTGGLDIRRLLLDLERQAGSGLAAFAVDGIKRVKKFFLGGGFFCQYMDVIDEKTGQKIGAGKVRLTGSVRSCVIKVCGLGAKRNPGARPDVPAPGIELTIGRAGTQVSRPANSLTQSEELLWCGKGIRNGELQGTSGARQIRLKGLPRGTGKVCGA